MVPAESWKTCSWVENSHTEEATRIRSKTLLILFLYTLAMLSLRASREPPFPCIAGSMRSGMISWKSWRTVDSEDSFRIQLVNNWALHLRSSKLNHSINLKICCYLPNGTKGPTTWGGRKFVDKWRLKFYLGRWSLPQAKDNVPGTWSRFFHPGSIMSVYDHPHLCMAWKYVFTDLGA